MFISGLDIILIIVALLSGLLAMVRGLTREVLSIASWVAAAIATIFAYSRFREMARERIDPDQLADIILIAGSFLLVLIVVSYVTMKISDFILDSRIGAIDRTLGFAFGVARGVLLVVVAYLFFAWLVPEETDRPSWIQTARFLPLIEQTGDALLNLLPEDPESAILDRVREELGGDQTPVEEPADGDQGIGGLIEGQPNGN